MIAKALNLTISNCRVATTTLAIVASRPRDEPSLLKTLDGPLLAGQAHAVLKAKPSCVVSGVPTQTSMTKMKQALRLATPCERKMAVRAGAD